VIFRNDRVVKKPVNALDMAVVLNTDPTKEPVDTLLATVPNEPRVWPVPPGTKVNHPLPQPFWNKLEEDCTKGKNVTPGKARRCDFITIPHNSNLGGGSALFPPLFLTPYNVDDAKRHQQMEPLVEIYQDKGASECRYDPRFLAGTNTIDEYCAFEILNGKTLGSASGVGSTGSSGGPAAPDTWGDRAYVRNVWKDGIQYAAKKTYDGITGHSVTLALAALGVVHVPQAPIEAAIALSIYFLAVELTNVRQGTLTLTQRAPWAVAAGFGLLHGLGFPGALAEVGLPTAEIPLALFSFNVGIELGQLAFVSAVLLVGAALGKLPVAWPRWAKPALAYGIGTIATFWFLQRAASLI
jgi:hypothetical protein